MPSPPPPQPPQNIIVGLSGANKSGEEDLAYYESRRGQGWEDPNNVKILTEWIHYASVYLDILSEATEGYRKTLRMNTIINLIVSTLASTLSVSTFNTNERDSPNAALALKITFTILTFTLTIAAGYIKVYQIQEKLENSLRLKQEWGLFGSKISSEMQLPLILRKNAIFLISTMKGTYLDLVKSDMGIKKDIIRRMAARSGLKEDDLTLSELFERIIKNEIYRIQDNAEESETMTAGLEKQLAMLAESYGLRPSPLRRNSRSINNIGISYPSTPVAEQYDGSITPPFFGSLLPKDATVIPVAPHVVVADPIPVDEVFKAARALKEAEAIKKAFAKKKELSAAAKPEADIKAEPSATKAFLNMFSSSSGQEDKSKKDDNAKQLLADRGRVSSFLRSPTQTKTVPRKSYAAEVINDQLKELASASASASAKREKELAAAKYADMQIVSVQRRSSSTTACTSCTACGEHMNGQINCDNCNEQRRSSLQELNSENDDNDAASMESAHNEE